MAGTQKAGIRLRVAGQEEQPPLEKAMFKTAVFIGLTLATQIVTSAAQARSHRHVLDANGNAAIAIVKSRSGVTARVAMSAKEQLQCVVDYVESRGVRVVSMRGIGKATVGGSLHPSGQALDINQNGRNVTRPYVPRQVSNAAADHCGVISGARWHYADNGHWNLNVMRAGHRIGSRIDAKSPFIWWRVSAISAEPAPILPRLRTEQLPARRK